MRRRGRGFHWRVWRLGKHYVPADGCSVAWLEQQERTAATHGIEQARIQQWPIRKLENEGGRHVFDAPEARHC